MFTRKHLSKIALIALLATSISACKKDNTETAPEEVATGTKEFKYLRVLVADELSTALTQIDPLTATVTTFNAKYPLANLYGTARKRYAAVLYQNQNLVEVFDSGLISHDDHIDVNGTPKWASITATGLKPTHFKSVNDESLIFNDSDGTLSLGKEADFNITGAKFKTINAGLLPHHGAMANFDNGTIAVTTTTASGVSPTKVIIIDKNGNRVQDSKVDFGAIHGNASDGEHAVFGGFTNASATAGGVLVVKSNGEQKVIQNPEGFGAFRLASIYYAESAKKFIGYVATKGAYMIDVNNNSITPIYSGADAFQCKVDYAGKNLLILTLDGKLRIYDLTTGKLKKEGTVISSVTATDTYKPVLEASARFAYIAVPASAEVYQINLTDFSQITKHKVSSRPVRLALFGFESSAGHND
ncbi:hypothetical protein ACJVDH_06130 [Pedobacter sp. AW1-32]|uniref:hypothetical protein n=1 Tax=Pedobacter sp. AW1-32 TaxID=3383026 RepID=UPI003FF14CEC